MEVPVVPKHIPYIDLTRQHGRIKQELLDAVGRVLDHGQLILGPEVLEFERRFAQLCGTRFAVAVNSGTDALVLALRALDLRPGDEVITVSNSFVATASAIALAGARPVFVDVGQDYNMDPSKIEPAITGRTKAILPVHLTGRPVDMGPILELTKRRGLYVVEDCAQAVLAEYRGRRVGSLGTLGCFSLHPLKTLNACGDGGALTTDDESLYDRLRILRNIGLKTRDSCEVWSGNSRLDTVQAALLLVKLEYLDEWTVKRRANAQFYREHLGDVPELRLPAERPFERPVYHTFVIQAERRDELKDFLADNGIETAVHYPVPIHLQKAAAELGYREGDFPVAEEQARQILSLPVYPELISDDLNYIVETIRKFYKR